MQGRLLGEDAGNCFKKVARVSSRGAVITALKIQLRMALKTENRRVAGGAKLLDEPVSIVVGNGMAEDEEIESFLLAECQRIFQALSRDNPVTLFFQQQTAGDQEILIVGNGKNTLNGFQVLHGEGSKVNNTNLRS